MPFTPSHTALKPKIMMTIGIVGMGLIGASFAKAIRSKTNYRILIADIDKTVMQKAALLGLSDGALTRSAFGHCELILLALYPEAILHWLNENAPFLPARVTVVDCGGIKRRICHVGNALAEQYGFTFIGGHPMAGREVWGLKSATANLYHGASMILTPSKSVSIEILAKWKAFFLSLGFGRIAIKTPEDHDRIIAYTSQLAHILSCSYIHSPTAREHRGLSAGSFQDMTRVASINSVMWSEIFSENRDMLLPEIDRLIANLQTYRNAIAEDDRSVVEEMLRQSSKRKAECFAKENE